MANKKIDALSTLTSLASDDLLVFYDVDGAGSEKTKNITYSNFETQISGAVGGGGGSVAHNDTTGLQGGDTDEYYHLDSADHTNLTTSGTPTEMYYVGDNGRMATTSKMTYIIDDTIFLGEVAVDKNPVTGLELDMISGAFYVFVEDGSGSASLMVNQTGARIGTPADTTIELSDASDAITFMANGSVEMTIGTDGMRLKNSIVYVNDILDSTDAIDNTSTDDQLATAKLIYDTVSGTSMDGTPTYMYYVDDSGDIATSEHMTYSVVVDKDGTQHHWLFGHSDTDSGMFFKTAVDGTEAFLVIRGAGGADKVRITHQGLHLENSSNLVNEFLNVNEADSIDSSSTDTQLATAKLIYNHVNTVSGSLGGVPDTQIINTILTATGKTGATFTEDGAVTLYHNEVEHFATMAGGVLVGGGIAAIATGTKFHYSVDNFNITNAEPGGDIYISGRKDDDLSFSTFLHGDPDGAMEFYFAGDKKLETTNSGIEVTGGIFVSDMKSGATQSGVGAAVNELWRTASHATLPDGVVMIGI